jgi:transposase
MTHITTIGLDLAKNVFHLVGCNSHGKVIIKKRLRRVQLTRFIVNLSPCLIGMEACSGAHHWARQFRAMGHQCKLMPAQYVKAFVRGNKNDYNDALGISEAVRQPEMRFVAIKTEAQQDTQALYRLREQRIKERTGLGNQLRGLLAEHGIVVGRGINVLRRQLPELLGATDNGLSPLFRELLNQGYQQLQQLDKHIIDYTKILTRLSQQNEACQRLQTIPGFGPINASVFASVVGNGSAYRCGRDVSASLGIVPGQHSTGGKNTLLGISKRGDSYLRCLLIHGARAVVIQAATKTDRLSLWINRIRAERGYNKATVALANKMARMGWAILRNETTYQIA